VARAARGANLVMGYLRMGAAMRSPIANLGKQNGGLGQLLLLQVRRGFSQVQHSWMSWLAERSARAATTPNPLL
jgi:hypothetical protein